MRECRDYIVLRIIVINQVNHPTAALCSLGIARCLDVGA